MIQLGKSPAGIVSADVPRLVDSRVLVQANSGAGKSMLLRLIAERAGPGVQIVILDPEGEFVTLRESLDVLIVGAEGEIPADPRGAGPLARRLAQLGISAVIDLFDLTLPDRRAFVRAFCESLLRVPRAHWRPMLVMIDEAHQFAPERSAGQAESTAAVINLMSQGRKRGFGGVLATQRLSKLNKDAAAEANNVFIGRTTLAIDQRSAGDVLGFNKKEDRLALRDLDPGGFIAFGPALTPGGPVQFQADRPKTTHPSPATRRSLRPPAPSNKIKSVLKELLDLPKRAAEEARDLTSAQAEIKTMRRRVRELERDAPPPDPEAIAAVVAQAERRTRADADRAFAAERAQLGRALADRDKRLGKIASLASTNGLAPPPEVAPAAPGEPRRQPVAVKLSRPEITRTAPSAPANVSAMGRCERAILAVLAQYPNGRTRSQVAILSRYSIKSSGFSNALSSLRTAGRIQGRGDLRPTARGIEDAGDVDPLPTGEELRAHWKERLGRCERAILDALCDAYPDELDRTDLAGRSGYSPTSSGFSNALSKLRTLQLIEGRGELRASDDLFEGPG